MAKKSTGKGIFTKIAAAGGKAVTIVTGILAFVLILYSSYVLYDTFYIQNQAAQNGGAAKQYRPEIIDDGSMPLSTETLAAVNKDYRAWLTIYDTNIDYPVMQGENDLYYASHDYRKESSLTGSIYVSSQNSADFSDSYNLIYGHHMDSEAFFGGLHNYADADYYDQHREGLLVLPGKVYDLKVFAVLEADAYDGTIYTAGNQDIAAMTEYLRSLSPIRFDEKTANKTEKILVMSTCQSARTNGRFIVIADARERTLNTQQMANAAPIADTDPAAPADPGMNGGNPQGGGQSTEVVETSEAPLASFIDSFTPTGGVSGDETWALLNLICVILTIYICAPLFSLKEKFGRKKLMQTANEKNEYTEIYQIERFRRRWVIGLMLEILISAGAVIFYLLTAKMDHSLTLIDKWTPLMLILLLAAWVVDIRLIRYREGHNGTSQTY